MADLSLQFGEVFELLHSFLQIKAEISEFFELLIHILAFGDEEVLVGLQVLRVVHLEAGFALTAVEAACVAHGILTGSLGHDIELDLVLRNLDMQVKFLFGVFSSLALNLVDDLFGVVNVRFFLGRFQLAEARCVKDVYLRFYVAAALRVLVVTF